MHACSYGLVKLQSLSVHLFCRHKSIKKTFECIEHFEIYHVAGIQLAIAVDSEA
jgi:hypothetical protein